MKILIACEFSGIVRDAFIAQGHDAMSCDLLPTERPGKHYLGDIRDVLYENWDMIIAFPPCTHLAVSGAKWFKQKMADGRQQQGINFFMLFTDLKCPRVAIENPVGIMSTVWRRPDQIIQPYWFGHEAQKQTCLWLQGLPELIPTDIVGKGKLWVNKNNGKKRGSAWTMSLPPSPDRWKIRSRTFPGIATAMAIQWVAG